MIHDPIKPVKPTDGDTGGAVCTDDDDDDDELTKKCQSNKEVN